MEDVQTLNEFIEKQDWESAIKFLSNGEPTLSSFKECIYKNIVSKRDYNQSTPCVALMRSYFFKRFDSIELFEKVLMITSAEEINSWPPPFFLTRCSPLFSDILSMYNNTIRLSRDNLLSLMKSLIDVHPEVLKEEVYRGGFLPIHVMFSFKVDRIFRTEYWLDIVTRSFPESVLIENHGGLTPLQLYFDNFIDGSIRTSIVEKEYYDNITTYDLFSDTNSWRSMLLLFRTAASVSYHDVRLNIHDYGSTWPLHMIVQLEYLTKQMLHVALQIHRRELSVKDNNGNLPLHCILKSKLSSNELSEMSRDYRLWKVVNRYTDAVGVPDSSGNFPIMTVAKTRPLWNDAIMKFLEYEPKISFQKDPDFDFYPFQLVAISCESCPRNRYQGAMELSSLFSCIRICPELVTDKKIVVEST